MLRRSVLALGAAAMVAGPALAAEDDLPGLDANGLTLPLRVDQLTPAERRIYDQLVGDDAGRYLYTRGFLRYCQRVVDRRLPAADLPPLPIRDNWRRDFLSAAEATGVVDAALDMKLAPVRAGMSPRTPVTVSSPDLPGVDADGRSLPLRLDQLRPEERATYDQLDPSGEDARQFLFTRGFLRYAQLVVDAKMEPASLPMLPVRADWDRQFLSERERTEVVDVALGMSLVARMSPSR